MRITDALKNLIEKMGGTKPTSNRVSDCVDAVCDLDFAVLPEVDAADNGKIAKVVDGAWAAGAETAELPAVTAADNGKVLMVVNGAWAAVTPSSD